MRVRFLLSDVCDSLEFATIHKLSVRRSSQALFKRLVVASEVAMIWRQWVANAAIIWSQWLTIRLVVQVRCWVQQSRAAKDAEC